MAGEEAGMVPTVDRDELFKRNLKAFEAPYPGLHKELAAIDEVHSELVFDEDGEPDIEFRGTGLYSQGAKKYAEAQLEDYWKNPLRIRFNPPQNTSLDDVGSEFNFRMLRKAVDSGIEFAGGPVNRKSFYLIVFGVGLGPHIDELVEMTECRGLVLVEPNREFLYHSLFVFDWVGLFERFDQAGMQIYVCSAQHHEGIHLEIRNFVRTTCAAFFDGTQIYTHYNNSIMDVAQRDLRDDAGLFLSGLGFLEDEILMIKNSFENLKEYDSHTYARADRISSLPAMVIGCGPSLDKSLDVIKQNRDRAILVSCGTTLGVLLANGIVPDFQIEMENVDLVFELMTDKAAKHDLSDICLVASTTIEPGVANLFPKKALFFRHSLGSWEVFNQGPESGLQDVGPTVTNAGFSFAQEIGCREVYLVGVDYGSTRLDRHHAADSDYKDGGKAENTNEWGAQRPGNFGGNVHTHHVFLWARATIEQSIRRYRRGRTYFNCSDGIAIDGALPKMPKTLSLSSDVDKVAELKAIMDGFPRYSAEKFEDSWFAEDWAENVDGLCDELLKRCEIEDESYPNRYLMEIARVIIPPDGNIGAQHLMIRGSMQMVLISASFYLSRVTDPEKLSEMEAIVRGEVVQIIKDMKKEAGDFLRGLWEGSKPAWAE